MNSNDGFFEAVTLLGSAVGYQQVFTTPDKTALRSTYRRLMKAVHPDLVDIAYRDIASEMTNVVSQFYTDACESLDAGTFGKPTLRMAFTSAIATHTVTAETSQFCDMTLGFRAQSAMDTQTVDTFLKVSKVPRDNELLETEASALRDLQQNAGSQHVMYYPELIDSFGVADGRKRLRANALAWQEGFLNLEEVRNYYPAGIHPLDMGWIWRRLLWALGGAHDCGWLHGAVLPRHILIHPVLHGVVLADWCYATQKSGTTFRPLRAVVGARRDWYPPEVAAKKSLLPRVDLVMAARSMQYVMGMNPPGGAWPSTVPFAMQQYFTTILSTTGEPNAYGLLSEFDELLQGLGDPYYPRNYRPLKI